MIAVLRRNIELKARCTDLHEAEQVCRDKIGAQDAGLLVQTDTYFAANDGARLKLREIAGAGSELIAYRRPDDINTRGSDYVIALVNEPTALIAALSLALGGIACRVHKRRRLLLADNVRIHLDDVELLGGFIEFEAVLDERHRDEARQHETLREYARTLGITESDRIACSYRELILAREVATSS